METLWKKEYFLRGSDFDKFHRIKPSAVLDLFQDAAGQHALDLGVGFEEMLRRDCLWVLTRIKFKILSQPKSYQKVVVKTWPLMPGRLIYRREYAIEDMEGVRIAAGSSEWVIIHSEKRRIVSVPDLYPFTEGFHQELMCEEKLAKVGDFPISGEPHRVAAGFSQLDGNNHVNNAKYANYVLDAIDPEQTQELEEFQIDYRKEVRQGAVLNIYHQKQDRVILAKGVSPEGETMFACRLDLKA